MIITLIEALLVFFIFGARWVINFLFSTLSYNISKDSRYTVSALILFAYENFWILDTLTHLFGNFEIMLAFSVFVTEIILLALCYGVIVIMALFSQSQTNYINYPGALICCTFAIPLIEFVMNIAHNIIPIIIIP